MKRAALYVRVSTAEQKEHGLSVDSQIVALRDYCAAHDLQEVAVYNDAGISARKRYTKRPALLQLINACEAGLVDVILFTKLDRWFRSVGDYYEVQAKLDAAGVPWRAIWEDYETETSAGVFKVNIMLSVAQSEADRTSERVRSVIDYKKARGDYVGTVPFGYLRENKKLVKDPKTEPLVELIFSTYLRTYSTVQTYRIAREAGYNKTFKALVNMLDHPAYSGGDGQYSCPPYLSPDQQKAAALAKAKRVKEYGPRHDYIFAGLCRCGYCGKRLSGHTACASKGSYANYQCNGFQDKLSHTKTVTIAEKKLETFMLSELESAVFDYNINIVAARGDTARQAAEKKKADLDAKRERVGLRFEMGEISADEYKAKIAAIKKAAASVVVPHSSKPVKLEAGWRDIYEKLDRSHRAMFWRNMVDYIVITPGKNPEIHLL